VDRSDTGVGRFEFNKRYGLSLLAVLATGCGVSDALTKACIPHDSVDEEELDDSAIELVARSIAELVELAEITGPAGN